MRLKREVSVKHLHDKMPRSCASTYSQTNMLDTRMIRLTSPYPTLPWRDETAMSAVEDTIADRNSQNDEYKKYILILQEPMPDHRWIRATTWWVMFESAAGNASGSKIIIKDIVMHRRNCNRVHTRDSSTLKRWSCTRPSVSHPEKYGARVLIPREGENLSKLESKVRKYIPLMWPQLGGRILARIPAETLEEPSLPKR
jgi:hypothetical protein